MKRTSIVAVLAVLFAMTLSAAADVIYVAEEQLLRVSTIQPNGQIQPYSYGAGLVYGLALDHAGNLYAAGAGDDTIRRMTPSGVSVYASSSTLGSPSGLAFDNAGNLYTSGLGWGKTVNRISPDGTISHVASGVGGYGLAFDKSGNLYVANWDSVSRISPSGIVSTFATGFNGAWGLAFNQSGNLFVANYVGNSISEVSPDGVVSTFATGLDLPTGLAFDSHGDLYVCNITQQALGNVCRITPEGATTIVATGLHYPTAIAILVPEPSVFCLAAAGLGMVLLRASAHRGRRPTLLGK
jgi:sugar lactone lactonase YvrE